MTLKVLLHKIRNRWIKLRLQPIEVFVFHQVSDVFDPSTMWECDWIETEKFKSEILNLKNKYKFISLCEAYRHLTNDFFRKERYAVLTCDDGWSSIYDILPWLTKLGISVTLFLNPEYLDGKHYQERNSERLLTFNDVATLINENKGFIYVGSHGWTHFDATKYNLDKFEDSIMMSDKELSKFSSKIPFYAFTYGSYRQEHVLALKKVNLIPVYTDGMSNYKYDGGIHRRCL